MRYDPEMCEKKVGHWRTKADTLDSVISTLRREKEQAVKALGEWMDRWDDCDLEEPQND